jgi:hypothetical protein
VSWLVTHFWTAVGIVAIVLLVLGACASYDGGGRRPLGFYYARRRARDKVIR